MSEQGKRDWDVECAACGIMVGQILDGHFVHHDECAFVPRIGSGVMRCCACGGKLTGRSRPVDETAQHDEESDEAPTPLATVSRFERRAANDAGGRRR